MPTDEKAREKTRDKSGASHVVKVTGMSVGLLDARVRQQQATGRAEYIRELIRRDALTALAAPTTPERGARRHKARRRNNAEAASEQQLLEEYHTLVDGELDGRLSPDA